MYDVFWAAKYLLLWFYFCVYMFSLKKITEMCLAKSVLKWRQDDQKDEKVEKKGRRLEKKEKKKEGEQYSLRPTVVPQLVISCPTVLCGTATGFIRTD